MSDFAGAAAAAAIRDALARCGAAAAFGLPGGPNHALFQALRTGPTRLVVPSHELAAAFMAGTFGRVSGQPGVLLTIPGPGFAYALAGIAEAWQDSAPLVHLVGAPPPGPHPRFRHQALDQAAIARPIVKALFAVRELGALDAVIGAAYETARGGEPGPVLVQLGAGEEVGAAAAAEPADTSAARAAWRRIHQARQPVLLLGQGCVKAAQPIRDYVVRTGTPVFTTPSGRGVVAEDSPWCLGYDTLRESTAALNAFLNEADLIVAVGARLAYNGTAGLALKLPPERLVHVDACAANLNTLYPAHCAAAFSAEAFFALPEAQAAPPTSWSPEALAPWRARICAVQARDPEPRLAGQSAREFFAALRALMPEDALVVTDSGLHQVLARRYYEVRAPHGLLLPTDLQSMGFGLPSAMAAKLAAPARAVVALLGDGGALMSALELAVAVREKVALTAIVFNDGYLNQIRLQQLTDCGRSHGVTLPVMDFAALAQAVGADYLATDARLRGVAGAVSADAVTLIEVRVSDSAAVRTAAAKNRVKGFIRSALGPRLRARVRGWLRR